MMPIRLLLASMDEARTQKYQEILKDFDIQLDVVTSLKDLHYTLMDTAYNGLLIDMATKIKAPGDEKSLITDTVKQYPTAQLILDIKTGNVRIQFLSKLEGGNTLEKFITQECESFKARRIRSSRRVSLHFNALVSKDAQFHEATTLKSATINVSKGGCLLYSNESWEMQSTAHFILKELNDQTPIQGTVCWTLPWGKAMTLPGFGIQFSHISKDQLTEIFEKIRMTF